jgi:hypothetical protein
MVYHHQTCPPRIAPVEMYSNVILRSKNMESNKAGYLEPKDLLWVTMIYYDFLWFSMIYYVCCSIDLLHSVFALAWKTNSNASSAWLETWN